MRKEIISMNSDPRSLQRTLTLSEESVGGKADVIVGDDNAKLGWAVRAETELTASARSSRCQCLVLHRAIINHPRDKITSLTS